MMNYSLLQETFLQTSELYPDKTAIVNNGHSYSYASLLNKVKYLASLFKVSGLQRGDRVVIKLGNSVETVIAFWACLICDAIVSVIPVDFDEERVNFVLQDSGARIYLTNDAVQKITISEVLIYSFAHNDRSGINSIIYLDINNFPDLNLNFKFKNNELDLASIIYTSGSTGQPKGVMLTHRNMLAALFSINKYLQHAHSDVFLSALPLSFDYGLYQMLMAFSVGATLILEKDATWPMQLLKKIGDYKVTVLPLVPTLANLLYDHNKRFNYDYSSLRVITNTGAALNELHISKLKEIFTSSLIYSMYGLTECKRCTYLPPEDLERKPGSVGIAIPNTEAWIVDENGLRVGPGVIGQLVIRGATVMQGYWNRPVETAAKLKPGIYFGEKVLYTGDYAVCDEDGYFYFKGRMDELIKYKGLKLNPIELEQKIARIDGVRDVVALSITDAQMDTALILCVQPDENRAESHAQLKQRLVSSLTSSQKTEHIYFLKALPKNNNGKTDKKSLREMLLKNELKSAFAESLQ